MRRRQKSFNLPKWIHDHCERQSYVTYRRSAIRTRRSSGDENDPSGTTSAQPQEPAEAFCGHSARWSRANSRPRRESRLSNESNSENLTSDEVDKILHRSSRIYNSRYANSRRKQYAIQEKWGRFPNNYDKNRKNDLEKVENHKR